MGPRVDDDQAMTDGSATYVYGVIAGSRRRTRRGRGLPGTGPVRLIDLDGNLSAAVADAPLQVYGEDQLGPKLSDLEWVSRAAIAHEAVLESFADATAVVPMKLFTLFTSEERALAHLRAERKRIASTVRRVANQQEWGVRLALGAARRAAASRARKRTGRAETGAQFLARKKADRDTAADRAAHAIETADRLFDRLTARASISKRRPATELSAAGGGLLLDAAFLVPRAKAKSFGSAVARGTLARPVGLCGPDERSLAGVFVRRMTMARKSSRRNRDLAAARVLEPPETTVLDLLDNLLNKGVLANGDLMLGVAGIDLIYLRLGALLCAADRVMPAPREKRRVRRHRRGGLLPDR
jgi:hypothetical protein